MPPTPFWIRLPEAFLHTIRGDLSLCSIGRLVQTLAVPRLCFSVSPDTPLFSDTSMCLHEDVRPESASGCISKQAGWCGRCKAAYGRRMSGAAACMPRW